MPSAPNLPSAALTRTTCTHPPGRQRPTFPSQAATAVACLAVLGWCDARARELTHARFAARDAQPACFAADPFKQLPDARAALLQLFHLLVHRMPRVSPFHPLPRLDCKLPRAVRAAQAQWNGKRRLRRSSRVGA
eukprot:1271396-Rhodomonas_salina.3